MRWDEIQLLEAIGGGQETFLREEFPDLDDIDRGLRVLVERGYVQKVVRAVSSKAKRIMRIDVVGGLTPLGEYRRKGLIAEAAALTPPYQFRGSG